MFLCLFWVQSRGIHRRTCLKFYCASLMAFLQWRHFSLWIYCSSFNLLLFQFVDMLQNLFDWIHDVDLNVHSFQLSSKLIISALSECSNSSSTIWCFAETNQTALFWNYEPKAAVNTRSTSPASYVVRL
jgi:hypothetical protein